MKMYYVPLPLDPVSSAAFMLTLMGEVYCLMFMMGIIYSVVATICQKKQSKGGKKENDSGIDSSSGYCDSIALYQHLSGNEKKQQGRAKRRKSRNRAEHSSDSQTRINI